MEIRPVTTDAEWDHAREIRQRVFVEEQECPPEEEWDEHDWHGAEADALHVVAYEDGRPVGTARWRVAEWEGRVVAKLERFAVLAEYRGGGRGRRLVLHLMEEARRAGHRTLLVHAQAHLERLYADLGFKSLGERFTEAGIPHVRMVLSER
jgi:predicted GNAT family N-acyltransferase